MTMNFDSILVFGVNSLAAILCAASAFAGSATSGGGGAIVCRDSSGKIQSARLLDLWEGEWDGFSIPKSGKSVEEQVQNALARLEQFNPKLAEDVREELASVEKNMRVLPKGVVLPSISDAYNELSSKDCNLETLAHYNDTKELLYVSFEIHSAISKTDRAALMMHEAVYRSFRKAAKESDSRRVRAITARLFSDRHWESPLRKAKFGEIAFKCEVDGFFKRTSTAYLFLNREQGTVAVQVLEALGYYLFEPPVFEFQNRKLERYFELNHKPLSYEECTELGGDAGWASTAHLEYGCRVERTEYEGRREATASDTEVRIQMSSGRHEFLNPLMTIWGSNSDGQGAWSEAMKCVPAGN